MIKQIEFKDLNRAGQEAVGQAQGLVYSAFKRWGFDCGISPFSDPKPEASIALEQALVDFLVAANQPAKSVPNECP